MAHSDGGKPCPDMASVPRAQMSRLILSRPRLQLDADYPEGVSRCLTGEEEHRQHPGGDGLVAGLALCETNWPVAQHSGSHML
jgi:hypothetical protein